MSAPSVRDLAERFIAARIDAAQPVSGCVMCLIAEGQSGGPCVAHLAAAILDTPEVEVGQTGAVVDWDTRPVKVAKRLVISLPWGSIEDERSASPTPADHTEEQG